MEKLGTAVGYVFLALLGLAALVAAIGYAVKPAGPVYLTPGIPPYQVAPGYQTMPSYQPTPNTPFMPNPNYDPRRPGSQGSLEPGSKGAKEDK
jgi:hypothetical protein